MTTWDPSRTPRPTTIPWGWGKKVLAGSETPKSEPAKRNTHFAQSFSRARDARIKIRENRLLLICGFLG